MLGEYVKISKFTFLFTLVLIGVLLAGLVYALTDNLLANLEEFDQIASVVSSNYMEDVNTKNMIKAGINGMLSTLDPYSAYLEPKQYHALIEDTQGKFEGLGIEIAIKDGWLTVISPLEDTPAERMGIQAGDRIIKIEGVSTKGINEEEAVSKLRGKKGTVVHITIEREGIGEPMEYSIERDVISIRSVPYYGIATDEIGYIRLNSFSDITADELKEATSELQRKKIKGLILDLRGNPGGLLSEAVGVANVFLEPNKLVVEIKGKVKFQNKEFYSSDKPLFPELPLAVLVDGGSASGSEIVAGAIQDWDRGVIIGDTTFGKGLVQTVFDLEDGAGLKLTTAKYFIPSGRSIQKPEDLKTGMTSLEESETDSVKSDSTQVKQKFFTKGGRVVYGGGGIAPDVTVPYEELSPLEYNLLAKLSFFDFAVHYTATHALLPKDFKVDEKMLSEFKQFLKTKDFSYKTASELELEKLKEAVKEEGRSEAVNQQIKRLEELLETEKETDFQKSEAYIKSEIKENILVKLYGQNAKYEGVWFKDHPQIKKAIEILSNLKEYKELLSAK
jgi:carboxyl-terminal processing protease